MKIVELSEKPALVEIAIDYFWKCWGNDSNHIFYKDCILNALDKKNQLPKFYIGLIDERIVGSYALLTNDLISRQDLMPWLACLFVNEDQRKQGFAEQLLTHGLQQAHSKGFKKLYLSTDLVNFYERKGWRHLCQGYGVTGGEIKIYEKSTAF